jgi:hypothetical protein
MASEEDTLDLLGRGPDQRLLTDQLSQLPPSVGHPEPLPPDSPMRRQVVGAGAALTGITLLAGIALVAVGIGEAVSDALVLAIVLIVIGLAFVGTHWGWVHVAELTGNAIQRRHSQPVLANRQAWLQGIEPYPRWEVSTVAEEDGSIAIVTTCHRPIASGEHTFTFVSEPRAREIHSADEPAATVAERAELLRRQAAVDTERARQDFEAARDAYEQALMVRDDEQQRRAALRAASEALSERINTHLRDPPLTE